MVPPFEFKSLANKNIHYYYYICNLYLKSISETKICIFKIENKNYICTRGERGCCPFPVFVLLN